LSPGSVEAADETLRPKELTLPVEHRQRRRDLVRREPKFRPLEHGSVFFEDLL
jgi:hypothetical protein